MSDETPYLPPHLRPRPTPPPPDLGQVGWGILLAGIILVGSVLVGGILGALLSHSMGGLGCMGGGLLALLGIPLAAVIAYAQGKPQTAKGLLIGFALVLGLSLLVIASLCGGMFRP